MVGVEKMRWNDYAWLFFAIFLFAGAIYRFITFNDLYVPLIVSTVGIACLYIFIKAYIRNGNKKSIDTYQ